MNKQLRTCLVALAVFTLLGLQTKAQFLATWGARSNSDTLAPGSTGAVGKVASGLFASKITFVDSVGNVAPFAGPNLGSGSGLRKSQAKVIYFGSGQQMEAVLAVKKKNTPTVDSTNGSGIVSVTGNFFNCKPSPKAYWTYSLTPNSGNYLDINEISFALVHTHSPSYNVKIVYYVDDCQHLNPITPDSFIYQGITTSNNPAYSALNSPASIGNVNNSRHPYPHFTIKQGGKTIRVFSKLEVRVYFYDNSSTTTNTGRFVGYDTAYVTGTVGTGSIGAVPSVYSLCTNAGGVTLSAANYTNIGSITNNNVGNPTYNALLQWAPATGLSATSGASVTANPTTTTTYTLGNGCGSQATSTFTVVVPSQVTLGSTSSTICTGTTTAITASGAVSYAWSPSVKQVFSGLTNIFLATPLSSTTYTVTGTDANGCITTAQDTITVGSSTAPTVTLGRSHVDTCSGSTVSLSASGAVAYAWKGSDGSTNIGSSISVSPSSTTLYLVTGTDGAGCKNSALDTVQIGATILSPITGSVSICNGSSTTIKAFGATTYSWSPSTGLSATTGAQVIANPTATTTYTVTGHIAGCTNTTATVIVTVNQSPNITAASASVCSGSIDSLFASNGTSFSWAPYSSLSTNVGSKVAASPNTTITYTVTNQNGCTGTYILGVNARPTASVSGNATICYGTTTNVSFTFTGTGPWNLTYSDGVATSSTTTSSNPYTVAVGPNYVRTYQVASLSDANCAAQSSDFNTTSAIVNVNKTPASVTIYPNLYDVCAGSVSKLKVTPAPTAIQSQSYTFTSTDTSAANNTLPNGKTVSVSGVPFGATISRMDVTCTVIFGSNFTNDIRLQLVSPNGKALSILNGEATKTTGASTQGMRNTVFSSASGGNNIANFQPPFTNTFYADTLLGVKVGNVNAPSSTSNVNSWRSLWNGLPADNGPNGTWTLWADNTFASSPLAIIKKYTLTIYYSYSPTITWTPSTGLYTDIGATVGYVGGSNSDSVYASPTSSTTYTANVSLGTCSATGTATVSVNANPTLSSSPSSITLCSGSSTTLSVSGTGTFSWAPSTGLSATTGSSVTANPTTTTIYTVTSTSGSCTAVAFDTVTVTSGTGPTISVSPTSANGCGGGSTSLTASGGTSYVWMPATGLSATTGSSVSASPTVTTTYTVVGSNGTCSNNATAVINVGVVAPAPVTICSGSTASLTATGATTYSWAPSTGLSASTGATVFANPTATTTYTVTGSISGCSTTTATVVVTVNPSPSFTVMPSATLCNGASATISVPNTTTYSWAPSTGLNTVTGASVTASPSTTTIYTVTTARGCSATQTITVNARPTSMLSGTASICNGSNATIVLALTGNSPWTVKYTDGANTTTTTTSHAADTITLTPGVTSTYRVTSLTDAHCAATQSSDTTGSATITVNADSTVAVTPSSFAAICAGGIDSFVATSHYTGSISGNSGAISQNISQSTTSTVNVSGIPANSTITRVVVGYTINKGGYTSDLTVNLTAPNNNTLNLQNHVGGSPALFVPIKFASDATTPTNITTALSNTYTYKADAGSSVKTRAGITSNVSSFKVLDSVLSTLSTSGNGNWILSANDSAGSGANGTLNYWYIKIYYTTSAPAITWAPTTGLYTDKAATMAYTGTATSKIYAKPTSTTTYTATVSYGTCADKSANGIANINPLPTGGFNPTTAINKCSAGAVTLPVALTGATPWSITYNDGSNHTVSSSSATYNVLGSVSASTNFIIKSVTDNNGCKAVLGSDSMRSVFVLSTNPTTVTPASSTVCNGNSQTFTLNGYPAGSGAIIKWQYNTNPYASNSNWTNFGTNSTSATISSINTTLYVRALDSATGCTVIASSDAVVKVDSAAKLSVGAITSSSVTLSWTPVVGATSYTINYGSSTATTSSTSYTLTGLTPCTAYSIYVSPNSSACSVGNSNTVSVTTLPTTITLTLDAISGNKMKAHWNGVKGNRYKFYFGTLVSLPNLTTVTLRDTAYTIDFSLATGYKGQTILMYVVLDSGSTCSTKPISNTQYANVAGGTCSYTGPVSLTSSSTATSVSIGWTGYASKYYVYYKAVGATSWVVYSTTSTSYTISGLPSAKCYVIFIANLCSGSPFTLGYTSVLDTICTQARCSTPTNLVLSNPKCHSFTATWNSISGVSNYSVYFTQTTGAGSPYAFSYRTTNNTFTPTSLSSGASYSVYVKANCSAGGQSFSTNVETMTTQSIGCKDDVNGGTTAYINGSFNIYPNPTTGNFIINMNTTSTAATATVDVMDVLGQVVYSQIAANNNGTVNQIVDLNSKAAGLYIVRVRCGNDVQDAKIQVIH